MLHAPYGRGYAKEDSDIDIMVVLRGDVDSWEEIKRTTDITYPLQLEHEEWVALFPVSLEAYEKRMSPLMINVRGEGVTLRLTR